MSDPKTNPVGFRGKSNFDLWRELPGNEDKTLEEFFASFGVGPEGPEGPQGPAGPAGADGADGAQGPIGPQGPAGQDGADGAQGPQGIQGPAGADGQDGADGAQGPAGADGAQGPIGPQGPAGQDGADGAAGADGAQGPQGIQGPVGPAGADGAQGPQGIQGPAGADGNDGADGAQGPIGPQGPAGADGADGADGAVVYGYAEHGWNENVARPAGGVVKAEMGGFVEPVNLGPRPDVWLPLTPDAPTGLALTPGDGQVTVELDEIEDANGFEAVDEAILLVEVTPSGGSAAVTSATYNTLTAAGAIRSLVISGLANGTEVSVRIAVRAPAPTPEGGYTTEFRTSPYSAAVVATPAAAVASDSIGAYTFESATAPAGANHTYAGRAGEPVWTDAAGTSEVETVAPMVGTKSLFLTNNDEVILPLGGDVPLFTFRFLFRPVDTAGGLNNLFTSRRTLFSVQHLLDDASTWATVINMEVQSMGADGTEWVPRLRATVSRDPDVTSAGSLVASAIHDGGNAPLTTLFAGLLEFDVGTGVLRVSVSDGVSTVFDTVTRSQAANPQRIRISPSQHAMMFDQMLVQDVIPDAARRANLLNPAFDITTL